MDNNIPTSTSNLKSESSPLETKHQYHQNTNLQLEINQQYFEKIMKEYVSYEKEPNIKKKSSNRPEQTIKLRKPQSVLSSSFKEIFLPKRNPMAASYNKEDLKLQEFMQMHQSFKLTKDLIKRLNPSDPKTLQTLRYAIYNKQLIPQPLVQVVKQMAKTHIIKQSEATYDLLFKVINFDILAQAFQPPLDLYMEFVDSGLIQPNKKQLMDIYSTNQYLMQREQNNEQLYKSKSQKKRLIYNQFPYLIEILDRASSLGDKAHTSARLELYMDNILRHLQFNLTDQLFQRYLPEVKCRYLKIKSKLNIFEIQFLFTTLNNINNTSSNDFQILYSTKPNSFPLIKQQVINSWASFWQIEELSSKILTNKEFHLSQKQLTQMGKQLNFQNSLPVDLVKYELILFILREQSYHCQPFSKSLIQNVDWIFKNIPDKKKRKQCAYILLLQFFKLVELFPKSRTEIIKQYSFPQQQLDSILDEGRQIALDVLLWQQDTNLILDESKCPTYLKIVKRVISQSKNQIIKKKAMQLQRKLNIVNNFQSRRITTLELNLNKNHQVIQLLEIGVINQKKLNVDSVKNILKILGESYDSQIRRSCLHTLRNVIENHMKGQPLPQNFCQNLILQFSKLYFQQNFSEECKIQTLKLAVECTNLVGTYQAIQFLTKFFFRVYSKSHINSFWNVNSSFGIYAIALNFKQFGHSQYRPVKQFMGQFLNEILQSYKNVLQPKSKSNVNILCAIVVLAKNQVKLPIQLAQQLTLIAIKNKDFILIPLLAIYFHIKNSRGSINQNSLLNICKILKRSNQNQIIGILILENYYLNQKQFPIKVIKKIQQLTKISKNQRLYKLYQNLLQLRSQENQIALTKGQQSIWLSEQLQLD